MTECESSCEERLIGALSSPACEGLRDARPAQYRLDCRVTTPLLKYKLVVLANDHWRVAVQAVKRLRCPAADGRHCTPALRRGLRDSPIGPTCGDSMGLKEPLLWF